MLQGLYLKMKKRSVLLVGCEEVFTSMTDEGKLAGNKIIFYKEGEKQLNTIKPSEYICMVGSLLFLSS